MNNVQKFLFRQVHLSNFADMFDKFLANTMILIYFILSKFTNYTCQSIAIES